MVAWVVHYDIPIPDSGTPALTQDVDFLGTKELAEQLASLIGAHIKVAGIDDHTANTAVLTFRRENTGQILLIDFLSCLIGMKEDEVQRLAVPMAYGVGKIHIMHPLLCMESRFINLHKLSSKRNGNGITQAGIAIEVARHYLTEMLARGDERQALNAVKRIKKLALSPSGKYCWKEYGLDPITAIDPTKFTSPMFIEKGWPALVAEVNNKRH